MINSVFNKTQVYFGPKLRRRSLREVPLLFHFALDVDRDSCPINGKPIPVTFIFVRGFGKQPQVLWSHQDQLRMDMGSMRQEPRSHR